jgi:bacteriocin biosynthesis cyclodehydratase domain-containing protein
LTVTSALIQKSEDRDILVLASGAFGEGVAERLSRHHRTTTQDVTSGTHPSFWPHTNLIVLATDFERPRIAEAVDRAAFAWDIPWFPVLSTANRIQAGPVIIPGSTACYDCFVRRRAQHDLADEAQRAADIKYPVAHPAHHVGIAVGLAEQAIDESFGLRPPDAIGATVRSFDQVNGGTSRAPVVAVDRCPRCRPARVPEDAGLLWLRLTEAAARPANPPLLPVDVEEHH